MMMNGNQTYCGDHFVVYTNVELLCSIPETNECYIPILLQKNKTKLSSHPGLQVYLHIVLQGTI